MHLHHFQYHSNRGEPTHPGQSHQRLRLELWMYGWIRVKDYESEKSENSRISGVQIFFEASRRYIIIVLCTSFLGNIIKVDHVKRCRHTYSQDGNRDCKLETLTTLCSTHELKLVSLLTISLQCHMMQAEYPVSIRNVPCVFYLCFCEPCKLKHEKCNLPCLCFLAVVLKCRFGRKAGLGFMEALRPRWRRLTNRKKWHSWTKAKRATREGWVLSPVQAVHCFEREATFWSRFAVLVARAAT